MRRRRKHYKVVAIGGTFDVFHKGHEQLISKALEIGQTVFIGVTSDGYAKKLGKSHPVQPYASRVQEVRRFIKSRGRSGAARTAPLHDPYGPAATRKDLEALVISSNTLANAVTLNQLRKAKHLRPLKIHRVRLARAEDGRPISSTRIRNGEIDPQGRVVRGN